MNNFFLVGNLTRTPELVKTREGTAFTRFSVAENRGEGKTNFFDCVAFGKTALTLTDYAKKGEAIALTARVEVVKMPTEEGGSVKKINFITQDVRLLGKRILEDDDDGEDEAAAPAPAPAPAPAKRKKAQPVEEYDDEENPF